MVKNIFLILFTLGALLSLGGCQTLSSGGSRSASAGALSPLTGAVAGKQLTPQELRRLERQIATDQEARSAMNAIAGSMGGTSSTVKYCPIDGARYAPHLKVCPVHQTDLKNVGE